MINLGDWLDTRLGWRRVWSRHFTEYQVPANLNIWYVFGFLALFALFIQVISGIWLTFFYTPTTRLAFSSIQLIMRHVNYGWLLRTLHTTGASALFIILYLHLFRGLLYGSYQNPRELVWLLGLGLFMGFALEASFGYVLPWGQLSYWGAQVLTALVGAIPGIGDTLMALLRGDSVVSGMTLARLYTLHILILPLILLCMVVLHIIAIRQVGSSNPAGIAEHAVIKIPFHPYHTLKDLLAGLIFLIAFCFVVFFFPEMGGYALDSLNFEPANLLVTPAHIRPAWYLAPFYAMLRAVPNKSLGIVVMLSAFLMIALLPWLDKSHQRVMRHKGLYSQCALLAMVMSFLLLGYIGTHPREFPNQTLARGCTALYFAWAVLMPWYTRFETPRVC